MDFLEQLIDKNYDPVILEGVRNLLGQVKESQQIIAQYETVIAAHETVIKKNHAELVLKDHQLKNSAIKIEKLMLELAHHRRIRFDKKNESLTGEQRHLFEEEWEIDLAGLTARLKQEQEKLKTSNEKKKRNHAGRASLPKDLPRVVHRHEPESCQCASCGEDLVKIREDVSEQLDVIPAQFIVHQHIRPQYACRSCETMTAAAVPPAIIDGGMAAPGLLAWVATSKFADHLPLYRIEQIAARQNVALSRSTLAQWVAQVGYALQPLVDRLSELLKQRNILHADETTVQQLAPGTGKTKRAYLWAYCSSYLDLGPPIILFEYQTSRAGHHAQSFLTGWQGHLMVDDYSGYKALFNSTTGASRVELGCLAHVRRKFFDLAKSGSLIAENALTQIAFLYVVEKEGQDKNVVERFELRQKQSKPALQNLHAWLIHTRTKTPDGSGTARALDYALNRWPALIRYVDSGILPIDNNVIENAIRPIAIGRKNWLFVGSEEAGRRAANIQSLFATAKANDLNPHQWLIETLEKLPTCKNKDIDSLFPLAKIYP